MNTESKLEKIKSIIFSLKLNKKKYTTEILNLNKCITYFHDKKFILKFNFDNTLLNFSTNEEKGYKNSDDLSQVYNLPKYETLIKTEKMHVAQIEYLGTKKGSYFNCNQFIRNIDYNKTYLKVNVRSYLSKIKKNYFSYSDLNKKTNIDHEINLFIEKEGQFILPVSTSHGDFVHWNTRKFNSKFYCYDLEQFNQERLYCYDIIHWYLMPFLQKISFVKSKMIRNKMFKIFNFFLKDKLKEFFSEFNKTEYNKFLLLYLLEKKMYYSMLINSNDILKKTSTFYYNQLIYLNNTIQDFINNILKINEK